MFTSQIRAAASRSGMEVQFARTAADVRERAHRFKPTLVIVDLECARVAPLDTIETLKSDPELPGTRVVGFVSHVQSELIAEAREAGIDEVMARSAFVAKLPALVAKPE